MARKIIVKLPNQDTPVLTESPAENEEQLQELVKQNPDVIPIEEFGFAGPMMVVGRETYLRSGAIDLVGVTRGGELLVIEFKTGPQNADFRHALAQLLDYGSDLWRMTYEDFENTVVRRYFASDRCAEDSLKGKSSLQEAAHKWWPDLSTEEVASFSDRLRGHLIDGEFEYVLVAQRFTESAQRTIEYLNTATKVSRFYAVELVRFTADKLSAFETRTILKPHIEVRADKGLTNETRFLDSIEDSGYKSVLQNLLGEFQSLGLRFEWGSLGTSIRLPVSEAGELLSIAWLFPPGQTGWMGLTDLALGYDPVSARKVIGDHPALDRYITTVGSFPGVEEAKTRLMPAYVLRPADVVRLKDQVVEAVRNLVEGIRQ